MRLSDGTNLEKWGRWPMIEMPAHEILARLFAIVVEEAKKSPVAKTVSSSKNTAPSTVPDWLGQINSQVFARHLHYSSSVSWKDSKGIHWDQWVE